MNTQFIFAALLFSLVAEARLPDLIPYRKGELWGYCDSTKKMIIEPQFEHISEFWGGTALIYDARGWGIIDTRGQIMLTPSYDYIDSYARNGCRLASRLATDKRGMITDSGKVIIPFLYTDMIWSGNFIIATHGDRVGVFNCAGEIVIPFKYTSRGEYAESRGDSGVFALVKKRGRHLRYGLVDSTGKVLLPFEYTWVTAHGTLGFLAYRNESAEAEYYTAGGKLIGSENPYRHHMQPWPVWTYDANGKHGYWVDTNGVRVKTKEYLSTEFFFCGRACFYSMDSLFGYINTDYVEVIPPVFAMAQDFGNSGLAFVSIEISPGVFRSGYIDLYGTRYWED